MSFAGYVPLKQEESDSESSDYGSPPPVTYTSQLVPRRWRRVVTLGSVGSLLVLLGFALCQLYPSRYKAASTSCCNSTFDYNSFYGIPKELPIVNGTHLANYTELNLQTGFNVSAVPTIRQYTFNITQALSAPDGFRKPMILINNQFPGPLIEANTGDTIQVKVNNFMSNWSTSVHWHGIDQKNSTWMDGVAAVSQCGIPPGKSFTYNFTLVDQRGTFWYHSHLSVQYTDGLFGPLIIHDPTELELIPKVDEQRIVFMGDWYHTYASLIVASYLNPTSKWMPKGPGVEAMADNLLLNGKNTYNCTINSTTFPPNHDRQPTPPCDPTQASNYVMEVKTGKTYRLRLINHSTFFSFWFSIDNHTISVVEMDGVEIKPIPDRGVYVNIAQRYSIIVTANQTVGNYYMRATLPTTCFIPYVPYTSMGLNFSSYFNVTGILSYDGTDPTAPPIGVAGNTSNPSGAADNPFNHIVWEGCNDMNFSTPEPLRVKPAYTISSGSNMQYFEFAFRQAQNINRIFINRTSWSPLENNATLWKTIGQDFTTPTGSYDNWKYKLDQQMLLLNDTGGAQIVINSLDAMEHPWHMHGHEFQIVGWGKGKYGQQPPTTEWKLSNPMRRDTVSVPAQSHVVLRILADNPGLWALHCHVAWHMEGGMFVQILERPIDLINLLDTTLPPAVKEKSMSFCNESGDQSFGTEAQWRPEDLVPSGSISDVTATTAAEGQSMGNSGMNGHKQAGEFK